jgi:lipopolysaccharide export system permease protein
MMARSFRRTWIYVGREYTFSFTVAFLFFFFIFFVNQILLMAEQIFSKRVPFWDVVLLVIYSLPIVVALAFPFGALVGALMAVGRLSSDNEILAFSVLGIPERHLLFPLLVLGLIFSCVSFIMNDYFFPLSNIRFAEIYKRIIYSNPAVELEPHSIKKYENTIIITGGVEGKSINDVLIIDKSPEGNRRVITARSASLTESAETKGVVSLGLEKVFSQVSYPKEGDRYDYFTADSMIYSILLKNMTGAIGNLTPQQQSSVDVWLQIQKMMKEKAAREAQKQERVKALLYGLSSAIRDSRQRLSADPSRLALEKKNIDALERTLQAERTRDAGDRTLQSYLVEFNRKFSLPIACLVFSFFSFPIGLMARRSGRTVGFAVGLLVSILYYGLLLVGQTFGGRMEMHPALSMWLPDVVVLAAGAGIFLVRITR